MKNIFSFQRLCFSSSGSFCVSLYGSVLLLSREELPSIRKNPYDSLVHLINRFSIKTTEIQCRMKLDKFYLDLIGVNANFMLEPAVAWTAFKIQTKTRTLWNCNDDKVLGKLDLFSASIWIIGIVFLFILIFQSCCSHNAKGCSLTRNLNRRACNLSAE